MVNFANPHLLYMLLAVPALAALYFWARYMRRRNIARFGSPRLLVALMPDVSRYLPAVKITAALIAIAALVVALARPRTQGSASEETMQGIEVMIAVDVSNSMLASSTDDPRGLSRLQRAKHVLSRLIDKLGQDRVGLIVFAGEAYTQLPLTPDFVSAKLYLNEISTSMVPNQGTSIGAAIEVAMNSFSGATDVERAIVVITDAEDQIGDAAAMAEVAHHDGIEVDVVGLGSGKGAQIPLDNSYTNWLKDENGQVVTTYLNEELAQQIASAGGGIYINGASSTALNDLVTRLDEIKKADLGKVTYTAADEQFPLFAWIALLAIVIDAVLSNRKIGFLRKYNFFSRSASVMALLLLPVAAMAQSIMPPATPVKDTSMRPERRFIREGNEQFSQGHYSEAEILYRRALDRNPQSEIAQFNQALSQLHLVADNQEANAELLQSAVGVMENLMQNALNPAVAERAAYSLGNLAFDNQDLQTALNMYKQTLRKNPANDLARENLRFVQKMMQNQNQDQNQDQNQEQQQQEQQQQEQQNQDQNQDQNQQQQQQQQPEQQQQQQQQNMSQQSRQQILDAVEKKDAAARGRANQNGQQGQPARRNPGRNW